MLAWAVAVAAAAVAVADGSGVAVSLVASVDGAVVGVVDGLLGAADATTGASSPSNMLRTTSILSHLFNWLNVLLGNLLFMRGVFLTLVSFFGGEPGIRLELGD